MKSHTVALNAIDELRDQIEELKSALSSSQSEIGELEDKLRDNQGSLEGEMADAVNVFLDCLDRPVGSLKFTVPQTDEVNRAILALYDAVGRNI